MLCILFSTLQMDNIIFPPRLAQCKSGDVWLEDDGTPLVFWNDKWSPICGHWFWNNQYGAELFCQKMGYTSGTLVNGIEVRGGPYSRDAIRVGQCNNGDTLERCTGGCNEYEVGNGGCANCVAGEDVKIKIACQGGSTKSSSCNVNSGKCN